MNVKIIFNFKANKKNNKIFYQNNNKNVIYR